MTADLDAMTVPLGESAAAADDTRRCVLPQRGGLPQVLHIGAVHAMGVLALVAIGAEAATVGVRGWELGLLFGMYLVSMLGVSLGFHRLASHRSFVPRPAVKAALIGMGQTAWQGPVFYWVALHRRHHLFADRAGDPHSPHWLDDRPARSGWDGLRHVQLAWPFTHRLSNAAVLCRDLYQDSLALAMNRQYRLCLALGFLVPALVGAACEPVLAGALKGLLWGGALRVFVVYHVINGVNFLAHRFGRRDFETRDESRNLPWLALPTLGEAWHNNHHACPSAAVYSRHARQLDPGGWLLRLLEAVGAVSGVTPPRSAPSSSSPQAPQDPHGR
jgi:stearoyl-CoA desaturase (delta-9 desaturase)